MKKNFPQRAFSEETEKENKQKKIKVKITILR